MRAIGQRLAAERLVGELAEARGGLLQSFVHRQRASNDQFERYHPLAERHRSPGCGKRR